MSTSIASNEASVVLIPSPLTLPPGVKGFWMLIGSAPLDAEKAKSSSAPSASSSSLGVSSSWLSSCPASSGYRPRSVADRGVRGCRGKSEQDVIRRRKAASDLTSASSGRVSARRLSILGAFNCNIAALSLIPGWRWSSRAPTGSEIRFPELAMRPKLSCISILVDDLRRGGVRGKVLVVEWICLAVVGFISSSLPFALRYGEFVPEVGESVFIRSLSLS